MRLGFIFVRMCLCSVALLAAIASDALAGEPARPKQAGAGVAASMEPARFNDQGAMEWPAAYPRWTLIGTSVGLDYLDAAARQAKSPERDESGPGTFHNVYTQPEAFDHYVATGEFPDQTVFVVTNNAPLRKEGAEEISQRGHFAGQPTGWEVSVKDAARFEGGWGYFMFFAGADRPKPAKPLPRQACFDCHAEHGERDNVFTQFYSVLNAAREERLANPAPASAGGR